MRLNLWYLIAPAGALLAPAAIRLPSRHLPPSLVGRQLPAFPLANDTGEQPCVANHDVYDCAERLMGIYAIKFANHSDTYPMKVPVTMYTKLNDTVQTKDSQKRNAYASGYVEVDARLQPQSCSLSGLIQTWQDEGFVCANHACAKKFQFSHLERTEKMWGRKWTAGVSVTVKTTIDAWFMFDVDISTTTSFSYENNEQETMVNETTSTQIEEYYLTNGQVCFPTTIQMKAECTVVAELPVTKLFQWKSDDGSLQKLTYCGSPNVPENLNPEFTQFCGEVGHQRNVTIWVENSGGEPMSVKGCAYMTKEKAKMAQTA